MGNIVWTKSWSSSDDGTTFGGADIQNIQSNITTVVNGSIDATNLAATLTFADADYIDLSAIVHDDTSLQGFRLPQIGASPASPTSGEGQIGWDQTNNVLKVYSGTAWSSVYSDISVRVRNSAAQTLTNNTEDVITFDTETFDTDTMHSTVANTGRLTATTAGKYFIYGSVQITANGTGTRYVIIRYGGTTNIAYEFEGSPAAGSDTMLNIGTQYSLAAGEYVELLAYQNSGGGLDTVVGSPRVPVFGMFKTA